MKHLQKLGRSLMLPVAILPVASLLLGIGYFIDPSGWGEGNVVSAFLIAAGSAILDNLGILFAIGVALGLSKDKNGASAMAALAGWLVVTTMLKPDTIAMLQQIPAEEVDAAFGSVATPFTGILVGILAATVYNKFSQTKLPDFLAFFSGRRLPPIITSVAALLLAIIMLFVWPPIYNALVGFGTWMTGLGAVGAGLFGFFNRLLIPTGLHHALNAVFWFDVIGIADISNFWSGTGTLGVTGMYQAGFFPVMMFGLPAAGFAIYTMADEDKKAKVGSLMLAAGFSAFVTGVTEPLEFAFMFIAPVLYLIHAVLTGISLFLAATFQWIAGFGFSAGAIDLFLSFNLPLANKPYMLIVLGLIYAVVYYFVFVTAIKMFNLKTPGRGVSVDADEPSDFTANASGNSDDKYVHRAKVFTEALGGKENITSLGNCTTRLRIEVADGEKINEEKIKSTGVPGINRTGKDSIQIIVGTDVQFVADEMEKL